MTFGRNSRSLWACNRGKSFLSCLSTPHTSFQESVGRFGVGNQQFTTLTIHAILAENLAESMEFSGAHHRRSSSLMSSEEEDEIAYPSRDPERRTAYRMNYAAYTQTTQSIPRANLKKPPPGSRSRSSLIDDDDQDENDERDHFHGYPKTIGVGTADLGDDYKSKPAASSSTFDGDDLLPSYRISPSGIGRNTLPGIGYGMSFPNDDPRAQRLERRTIMPEQPLVSNRKAPPPSSLRKDPPSNGTKPPVATVDFRHSIAMLTAQIDQPDEETLLTQHAQKTLLEIQSATAGRCKDEGKSNGNVNDDEDTADPSLPRLSEASRTVSSILSQNIHKPLEPNASMRRLRQPFSPSNEALCDVTTGQTSGSITAMDHRVSCLSCATPLVTAKSVIMVICPRCHCKFPNRRAAGVKAPPPISLQTEWSI